MTESVAPIPKSNTLTHTFNHIFRWKLFLQTFFVCTCQKNAIKKKVIEKKPLPYNWMEIGRHFLAAKKTYRVTCQLFFLVNE